MCVCNEIIIERLYSTPMVLVSKGRPNTPTNSCSMVTDPRV